VFLTSISILLMYLDQTQARLADLRHFFSTLATPIEYAVDFPSSSVRWANNTLATKANLATENERLRQQLLILQGQVQRSAELQKENNQLRELLHSSPKTADKVMVAQLLAVVADSFNQEAVVDKGKSSGVYEGQPVLDAHGLYGQVIEVSRYTSRILMLSDTRSAIPIVDQRSNLRGIVAGLGANHALSLLNMAETADIKVGDLLVTSGLGDNFPMGYPVGRVTSIKIHQGEGFANISVEPAANLNSSRLVLLMWPGKNTQAFIHIKKTCILTAESFKSFFSGVKTRAG
jgi:rod shape-determining protein MreC